MPRLLGRHWTKLLIALVVLGWAFLYLPATPGFAVVQLKRAVDARDGQRAAAFVDFEAVVKHAGNELLQEKTSGRDILGQLLGKGALELLTRPVAAGLEQWAVREVDSGAKEVQMPGFAVVAAMFLMKRDGELAYTRFRDHKGQVWEVRMARGSEGQWRVIEVKDIRQILEKLKRSEAKDFGLR